MFFSYAAIFSTLTLLASAQDSGPLAALPSDITPAESSKVVNDLAAYVTSVESQPQFTNAAAALASAVPTSLQSDLLDDPVDFFQSVFTASPTPEWLSAVPTSVLAYYSGINADVISIATKDVMGASATVTGSKVSVMTTGSTASAMMTGSAASSMATAKSGESMKSSGTSSTGSAAGQATGGAAQRMPVLGAGVLGGFGVAVAGAML